MPSALFVIGNSSVNIRDTEGILTDKGKQITNAVFGKGAKDVGALGKGVHKHYGIGSDGFDIDETIYGKNVLPFKLLNVSEKISYLVNPNDLATLSVNYFNKKSEGSTVTETNTQGQLVPVDELPVLSLTSKVLPAPPPPPPFCVYPKKVVAPPSLPLVWPVSPAELAPFVPPAPPLPIVIE